MNNNAVPGTEECDNGGANSDSVADACRTDCTNPSCGDGVTDTGEQCDDGNADDTDACTNSCLNAVCGDGIVEAGVEECDDGNVFATDACTSSCLNAVCGDGFVEAGVEECEDGNTADGDGCSGTCQLEPLVTPAGPPPLVGGGGCNLRQDGASAEAPRVLFALLFLLGILIAGRPLFSFKRK